MNRGSGVPMERTLLLVQLKVHTACLCSGPLLYEKPLAGIDKMLELIKNTDKDTREYFSSNNCEKTSPVALPVFILRVLFAEASKSTYR